jgi:3-phenylpropionate/cinnamic acid dioxygenase small subunit
MKTTLDSREIEQFLYYEAALLDEHKYEEWLELFTEDSVYWIPAGREERNPEKVTSFIYDNRQQLARRVRRLLHPAVHCQTPASQTSHLIANVRVDELGGREIQVHSTFALFESRLDDQRAFSGRCEHRLRRADSSWRIATKTVKLVNSHAVFSNLTFLF